MTEDVELREQDKWLPIANVYRIMKNALPRNAKVSKEAKECVQECVSEFVSFITSEASEKCSAEKRKTVNGEDVLFAMASLGFENYAEVLKIYLTKYREYQNSRDRAKRGASVSSSALLDEEDMKDENNTANLSNLSDMSTLSSLAGQAPGASHIDSGDVDLLQGESRVLREPRDDSQSSVGLEQRSSRDEGDANAASDEDASGNIVDYAEDEPIYDDFQID